MIVEVWQVVAYFMIGATIGYVLGYSHDDDFERVAMVVGLAMVWLPFGAVALMLLLCWGGLTCVDWVAKNILILVGKPKS